jgi:hypothetical protein
MDCAVRMNFDFLILKSVLEKSWIPLKLLLFRS